MLLLLLLGVQRAGGVQAGGAPRQRQAAGAPLSRLMRLMHHHPPIFLKLQAEHKEVLNRQVRQQQADARSASAAAAAAADEAFLQSECWLVAGWPRLVGGGWPGGLAAAAAVGWPGGGGAALQPRICADAPFLLPPPPHPPGVPSMSEEELRAELGQRSKALQRRAASLASAGACEADFAAPGEQRLFADLQATQASRPTGA